MTRDDILWVEKYRPTKISDTILPKELKRTFEAFLEQRKCPNLILSGQAGVGKTTIARALLDEIGADYIIINGSMHGNIDTLRNDIKQFASAVSFGGGRKFVILDEADYLNANSTQPALRNFMEEYSSNCGFILTCNYKQRIIPALHSRCSVVDFVIPKKEAPHIAQKMFERIMSILEQEDVECSNPKIIAELVQNRYPDMRRMINDLQRYSISGTIDEGILSSNQSTAIGDLVNLMRDKNFTEVRKWVGTNTVDNVTVFRQLYDALVPVLDKSDIPQLVLVIADYQYKAAFVADAEINVTACIAEIMGSCSFK